MEKSNVILIVIDTLRPDHLGCYGYERNTSPNMDKFARDGSMFVNTYCTLSRSDPTMTSMLTGMYPHSHGIRMVWGNKPNPAVSTLQEILKSHGYGTACFRSGAGRGDRFEEYWDHFDSLSWKIRNKARRMLYKTFNPNNFLGVAEEKLKDAQRWIEKNKKSPFFVKIHMNDLHWPYPVPKPFENMYDPDYKGDHDFATMKKGEMTRGELIFGIKKLPDEEIQHAKAHYDGGIRYIDTKLGEFFAFLKNNELYDNSFIIITADHGENFGEHNFYFQHGASLYETSIKTPLILRYPQKIPANKQINHRVQSLDIMPTVLDVLEIPLVDNVEGETLLPLIKEGKNLQRDFTFAESIEEHFDGNARVYIKGVKGKWRMMIQEDWKIIYIPHPKEDIFELYNLKEDPKEEHNLITNEVEKAETMKKKILDFLKTQSNEGDPDEQDLTEKSRKLLVQAGYLEEKKE